MAAELFLPNQAYIDAVSRFIFVEDEPETSDIIFIPGSSHDEHVRLASRLYHDGYAPYILPSGMHAKAADAFTADPAYASEWAWMRHLLIELGVPAERILREDQATFTWENATFSRKVTDSLGLQVKTAILCCRSYHARRALFYYQAAFPETRFLTVPALVPGITRDTWFRSEAGRHEVLGEVRRMGSQVLEIFDCLMEGKEPPLANTIPYEGN